MVFWSKPPVAFARMQAEYNGTWYDVPAYSDTYPYPIFSLGFEGNILDVRYFAYDGELAAGSNKASTAAHLFTFDGTTWNRYRSHVYFDETFTAIGTSSAFDTVTGMTHHTFRVTADATGFTVSLEGSIDGTNFFPLYTISAATDTEYIIFVTYKPVRYLRFNVTDLGTATTITCQCFSIR